MMKARLLLLVACAWGVAQAAFQEVEWVETMGGGGDKHPLCARLYGPL